MQGLHVVESFDGQGLVIASFADQGLARLDLVLPGLDAFRSIPTKRDHLRHTGVAAKDPITQLVKFIQLYAALFGFESAVYAFGRWSAFLEAAGRRIGQLLWSIYVDDGDLIDLAAAKGSGQALIGTMFQLMGAELRAKKRHLMDPTGEFLGLAHDLSDVASQQIETVWPRSGLTDEIRAILTGIRVRRLCTPATASKFRGVQSFCGMGMFGKVSKAAIAPFRQ